MNQNKEVYLLGAGPGDVELLTLKAVKLLKRADVVLYDALVNPKVLDFCKEEVVLENVGKRKNRHLKNQEEINEMLIKYANKFSCVIRLKGGTPFVFGRGFEEVRALRGAGFTPVVYSGVSSTTAVPESFMIPLVDRAYNDAYRTITGHHMHVFEEIVDKYIARENLVIMMGIHNLEPIVQYLLRIGFPPTLPIAILSKGTTDEAQHIRSSLSAIEEKEKSFFQDIRALTPAIIFVGKSIEMNQD